DHQVGAPFLPRELKHKRLADLLQEPLEYIPDDALEVDFAGALESGQYIQKVIHTLNQKPNIHIFSFRNNSLNESDLNALLDFLLTRENLVKVDLSGLPITKASLNKLKKLIKQVDRGLGAKQAPTLYIVLSNHNNDFDNFELIRFLKTINHKKVE